MRGFQLKLSTLKSLPFQLKAKAFLAGSLFVAISHHLSKGHHEMPVWQVAFVFALLSGLSLPLGAAVGIWMTPVRDEVDTEASDYSSNSFGQTDEEVRAAELRQEVVGCCLAFGAGSLLFAVTIELYGEAMIDLENDGYVKGSWEVIAMCAAAMAGAIVYIRINRWLEDVLTQDEELEISERPEQLLRMSFVSPSSHVALGLAGEKPSALAEPELMPRRHSEVLDRSGSFHGGTGQGSPMRRSSFAGPSYGSTPLREAARTDPQALGWDRRPGPAAKSAKVRILALSSALGPSKGRAWSNESSPSSPGSPMSLSRSKSRDHESAQSTPELPKDHRLDLSLHSVPEAPSPEESPRSTPAKERPAPEPETEAEPAPEARVSRRRRQSLEEEKLEKEKEQKALVTGMATWLGVFMDGLPEGVLLGFMAAEGHLSMALVVSLFIANFPEALSSASLLREARKPVWVILSIWTGLFVITAVLAAIAAAAVPQGELPFHWRIFISVIEGIAGGAMLACITAVMLPHAYHMHGDVTGLMAVAGFLCAVLIKVFGGVANEWATDDGVRTSAAAAHHFFLARHKYLATSPMRMGRW